MPHANPIRRFAPALVLAVVAGLALALLPAADAAARQAGFTKAQKKLVDAVPEPYRGWLYTVELILDDQELEAFFELGEGYQRDAFIDRFWRIRDTYPDTSRNEFKERWMDRVQTARGEYGNITEDRARILLLNGPPAGRVAVRCSSMLYPVEVWYYSGSDRLRREFLLLFAQMRGFHDFRLWRPFDGLEPLIDAMANPQDVNLRNIALSCRDGDKVVAAIQFALGDQVGFEQIVDRILSTPEVAAGEWLATFDAYSTELPEDAVPLPAQISTAFPGRHQSRTTVQTTVSVPRAEATAVELAGYRSYNFLITGEVLNGTELFDSFRYKFDFPAVEVPDEKIPLVFERNLRPGDYTLIVKVEDVNGQRFFRSESALAVPEVDHAAPPPPPADPETARLLAEANAAIGTGETTLQIIEPRDELSTGYHRFETLTTGNDIERVSFVLDGKPVLTKRSPPFSVDLDLGSLPRSHVLRAMAFDGGGEEVARDEITINASRHRFAVRLVEPRRGKTYRDSLRAEAEVEVPEGQAVDRVELFLNETRVATLYQQPWVQPIVLPDDQPLAYVRAVAYLPDGNSTEDLVFVNSPDFLEEVDVQFVELYTTVLDRQGRPVDGLAEGDFRVVEDGVGQQIARFQQVRDLPIWSAILLDVSASMEESLPAARDAALSFFEQVVEPKDRAAVITFNDRPNQAVKFTNQVDELAGGLAGLKAERGTALYDSLIFSLYYFNGIKGQRALLVLSDGKDESSRFSYEQTLEYARRTGVTIYTVALNDDVAHKKLSKIAEVTGGRAYLIHNAAELAPIYDQIQRELRSQYLIAYQSTNATGSTDYRSVDLQVQKPGLEAKTIQGYYP
jgi:VWFA-related protein